MAYAEQTKVPLEQSIGEIIAMARKAGADQLWQMQESDRFSVGFTMAERMMRFSVALVTEYDGPSVAGNGREINSQAKIDQANRQKGRALMLVIKAKLESVESGVETFDQAFLANIVTANKQTVYERISETLAIEYREGRVNGSPMLEYHDGGDA